VSETHGGDEVTDDQKLDALVAKLNDEAWRWCADVAGGYPAQWEVVARHVVGASVDHDEAPQLTVIEPADALDRWQKANAMHDEDDDMSWSDALHEAGLCPS